MSEPDNFDGTYEEPEDEVYNPNPVNEDSFEHYSSNGTIFKCERCDLREPIYYTGEPENLELFLQDISEFIAFHCIHIWPHLDSFNGYDTVQFRKKKSK